MYGLEYSSFYWSSSLDCIFLLKPVTTKQKKKNKTILTLEQIKAFETDVQNGAEIDLKEYLKTFEKDYDNTISSSSLHLSNWISKTIKDVLTNAIKSLAKMVS